MSSSICFLPTQETWGSIFTIRTGPWEFSQRLVTQRFKRADGLCPNDVCFANGRVWRGVEWAQIEPHEWQPVLTNATALETPEEKDVFAALGLRWIDPWERG